MGVVRVIGLREFIRAADRASRDTKRLVRQELARAAEPVREEAERRFKRYNQVSAGGYRVSVRRAGLVYLVQSKRKVTGLRPDYGSLQMREAFIPAGEAKSGEVRNEMEQAVIRIKERIERTTL